MAIDEIFKQRKFKLMMAALKRIDCNILHFTFVDPFVTNHNDLIAYNLNQASRHPEHLVFMQNGVCLNVNFDTLGLRPEQLFHNSYEDGSVDPSDYGIIFDHLIGMNTWIGTSSGKTLLVGDGTDVYQLEIEVDLHNVD